MGQLPNAAASIHCVLNDLYMEKKQKKKKKEKKKLYPGKLQASHQKVRIAKK